MDVRLAGPNLPAGGGDVTYDEARRRYYLAKLERAVLESESDCSSAMWYARWVGPLAIPWLREQTLKHPAAAVRRLAIWCLGSIGGPEVTEACLQALFDGSVEDARLALGYLRDRADPAHLGALLAAYDRSGDPCVRYGLALAIGRMEEAVSLVQDLRRRSAREDDPHVREALVTALARLHDAEAQAEFVRGLGASRGGDRGRYLDHCTYILGMPHHRLSRDDHLRRRRAHWLLEPLAPLLDDVTPLVDDEEFASMDGDLERPDPSRDRRVCDTTLNLVADISGRRFTFPVADWYAQYTEVQRAEVKRYLERRRSRPPAPSR